MSQPTMIFRQKSNHQTRCDYCHKPVHEFYSVDMDEFRYHFCSVLHARTAKDNFTFKKDNGITPVNLEPINEETTEEYMEQHYG